jgi:uncharacterized membrane protein YfcA
LLFLVAIVAGAANAIAGGGGLVTFPVLMSVVSPVAADATSAVALFPAYVTATWAGRKHLAPVRHWLWLLLGPCLLGGFLGALLLKWTGNRSFVELIPWLILLATLLTLRPLISRRPPAREPSELAAVAEAPTLSIAFQIIAGALLFLVAIYGGYFGAGIGILMIGAFGLIGLNDIHAILPLKNALAGCLRAMAVGVFLFEGEWPGNMAYLWQLARFSAGISVEKSADI